MESSRTFREVAVTLREDITGGRVAPGTMLPTERDLQARFGVSRGTVRRALQSLVEEGWAESLPNRGVAAREGRRMREGGVVGFVDHADLVHQSLFFRLSEALERRGLHLAIVDSRPGLETALERCVERGFCAAVVWSKTATPDLDRVRAVARRLPLVAVDHRLRGFESDVVEPEMFEAVRRVVDHLYRHGRRRVALTGALDLEDTTQERLAGYFAGVYGQGETPRARDLVFCDAGPDGADFHNLLFRLREPDAPDAVVLLTDIHAPALVSAVTAAGVRVPRDLAVFGIGNDVPLAIGPVGLSTVAIDWPTGAELLADRLVLRLDGSREPFGRHTVPTRLVVRGSCGAPASEWSDEPYLPNRLLPVPAPSAAPAAPTRPVAGATPVPA